MSPFLEIGANAGHTSYMLANEFGADGFALDISADSLRHGIALMDRWDLSRAPVRVAGDAANLPFRDGSLRFVWPFRCSASSWTSRACSVEVKRVLAPGGVFLFAEEPLRRLLSLRLYRCPYYNTHEALGTEALRVGPAGLPGARRHRRRIRRRASASARTTACTWRTGTRWCSKHFADARYEVFVPERGWGERVVKRLAIRLDPHRSDGAPRACWAERSSAVCKKAGGRRIRPGDRALRRPCCAAPIATPRWRATRAIAALLRLRLPRANEGGVYNLLPSAERAELYPGERDDVIDFSLPRHAAHLLEGWYDLEGVFGNNTAGSARARWHAGAAGEGEWRLRVRGYAQQTQFQQANPFAWNSLRTASGWPARPGTPRPVRPGSRSPRRRRARHRDRGFPGLERAGDRRPITVNLSLIRLVPRD